MNEQDRPSAWMLLKSQTEDLTVQIAKCKLSAPIAGMVVYAQRFGPAAADRDLPPPIAEGAIVRERQLIFRIIPDVAIPRGPDPSRAP